MNIGSLISFLIVGGIIAWNIYAYIQWKQAQEFIDIYNPHMNQISLNLQNLSNNFLELEKQITSVSILDEDSINSIKQLEELLKKENIQYYEGIIQSVSILESQACILLKHSQQECINFVSSYREIVGIFQEEKYEKMDMVLEGINVKSQKLNEAILKDNIEFSIQ